MRRLEVWAGIAAACCVFACGSSGSVTTGEEGVEVVIEEPAPTAAPAPAPTPEPERLERASFAHDFGDFTLEANQEIAAQCVAWTLHNDEPLYVSKVTLANGGSYHHSNWFVVPESLYAGPDGFFRCRDREFNEVNSAVAGTVLFAQSTQALLEEQEFAEGAVVKIPPRHKVVSGVHLLNPTARESTTFLRMTLELEHPRNVDVVLAPFRLSYFDLDIPAQSLSHFTQDCDMDTPFQQAVGRPLDLKLYWVLPHYHELGNYFRVEILGGPNDGQVIHTLNTFNAEANGLALDPPIDLSGATGLRLTCGYRNPRDESVGWGIGDQEMCVMLGLADSEVLMDLGTGEGNTVVGTEDGIVMNEGPCDQSLGVPRNPAQTLPTAEEIEAPLYVPEALPADVDLPAVPPCVDTPAESLSLPPATLTSIREGIFEGGCNFQACHDSLDPAAGLVLEGDDLHANLLEHEIQSADTAMPLVAPGDPQGSWLFRVLSQCEPVDDSGLVRAHMPLNSPVLLPPEVVNKVRDWILEGAQDD